MEPISREELDKHVNNGEDAFIIAISNPGGLTYVRKRKHLDHFISELKRSGKKIVVWSAGLQIYVKAVCNVLFGRDTLEFLLTNVHHHPVVIGRTSRYLEVMVYYPISNWMTLFSLTIILEMHFDNPKHFIEIKSFLMTDDDELLRVSSSSFNTNIVIDYNIEISSSHFKLPQC